MTAKVWAVMEGLEHYNFLKPLLTPETAKTSA